MNPEYQPFAEILSVSTMTLATSSEGGAHAAPVYFVCDSRLSLYYFSEKKSRHSKDIDRNPQAAAAIYSQCKGWQDIRGLQIHGKVCKVEPSQEWEAAWDLYQHKFSFVKSLKAVVARNQMYVLVPHWIRLVDNHRGFGYKEEWNLGQDGS